MTEGQVSEMARHDRSGNHLLDALPDRERGPLLDSADLISLDARTLQFRQGEHISTVHFPVNAVLSLVTLLRDGTAIEVTTIGNEGTTAAPVFLGTGRMSNAQCICQVAGDALAIRSDDFQRLTDSSPTLRSVMNRYIATLLTQVGQAVACSKLHPISQRCARWLLMTHDRVGRDNFHLTHEFLGFMLGVRRASVSDALATLNKAGVIRSRRGDIEILDRRGLHRMACECYDVIAEAMTTVTEPEPR